MSAMASMCDLVHNLQKENRELKEKLATVTEQLSEAVSNAGWEREYYQQLARESDSGEWK